MYLRAPDLAAQGVHVVSTDEKTGIQALERTREARPMRPGLVERQEFEYRRHGTQCLIGNLEVATGKVIAPTVGSTRTERDFLDPIAGTVDMDPEAGWVFVVDRLNTHMSESLVQFVAERCGINLDLGEKGRSGILESRHTRAEFLADETHRIRFLYTPKHASWLNQIELWFGILVRRLLRRASFRNVDELRERILRFIEYFNRVLARPFNWTYTGRLRVGS